MHILIQAQRPVQQLYHLGEYCPENRKSFTQNIHETIEVDGNITLSDLEKYTKEIVIKKFDPLKDMQIPGIITTKIEIFI